MLKGTTKLEVRHILWLVRKWFWLILLASLIGSAVGLVVSFILPKTYEADATIYLTSPNHSDASTVQGDQQRAKAFTLLPQSTPVLLATLRAIGGKSLSVAQLYSMITVVNNRDTQFVTIEVHDNLPQRAARLATEIAKQSIAQYETTATDTGAKQFLKQEMDLLAAEIQNREKALAQLQHSASPSAFSTSQTALINQMDTSLSQERTLYNQMFTSYNNIISSQAIVLQEAQIPQEPVGAGPKVSIAIGLLAGLIGIAAVVFFIEQTNGIQDVFSQIAPATVVPTKVIIHGLQIKEKPKQVQSIVTNLNGLEPHETTQQEKESTVRVSDASAGATVQPTPPLHCPKCNIPTLPQASFCPHCGYSLDHHTHAVFPRRHYRVQNA